MEKCEYEEVFTNSGIELSEHDNNKWKPLMRQCMICIGIWYIYVIQGLYLGAPTVLVAQVRREANSTQAVTDEMSSWLASMQAISALPLTFLLPWLFHRIGRKFTFLIVCILSSIGFIIFYTSTKLHHILISQMFIGVVQAAVNSFTPILIAEYTSPKYRGIFLTFKSVSNFWGIWVSNVIGTYLHWRNIAVVSMVFCIYVITVLIWPESPYWLAMKGHYKASAKSHRWLKGVNENSEKELAQLIIFQRNSNYISNLTNDIDDFCFFSRFSRTWSTITTRSFYKPTLICVLLYAQYHFTGKLVISVYAIEVLKGMTQNESVAYKGMLILDGITVFSMYVGCILSRYFKRRVLLFLFAIIGNSLLYILAFYLYLISLSFVKVDNVLVILLLSVFSIAVGCGPIILSSSIYGEIAPVHFQGLTMTIVGLSTMLIMSTLLKLSPLMFNVLKMHGCFLFYAVCSTFIIIILYVHLPETKDKTIEEISEYFSENQLPVPQSKTLL